MADESYDLILYGLRQDVTVSKQTIKVLAEALNIDEGIFARAAQSSRGVVLRRGLPRDTAERYRVLLAKAGASCNLRPARKAVDLALEPTKETPAEIRPFSCPACGFQHVPSGTDAPLLVCPVCGIAPEKFLKRQQLQAQREDIEASLNGQDEPEVSQRAAEAKERTELELWETPEVEIREELALPRALSTRGRAMAAGFAVWTAGLIMGAGVLGLYQSLSATDEAALPASPTPAGAAGNANSYGAVSSSVPDDMVLQSFTARLPNPSTLADGGNMAARSVALSGRQVDTTAAPVAKPITLDWEQVLDTDDTEPAWNRWVGLAVQRALAAGQGDLALKLARSLPPGEAAWRSILAVATDRQQHGQAAGRDEVLKALEADILAIPIKLDRIQGLSSLAEASAVMGLSELASRLAGQIQADIDSLNPGEGKAVASVYQASLRAKLGQNSLSESVWRDVIRLLVSEKDSLIKLDIYVGLADSYIKAGDRPTAVGLLMDALRSVERSANSEQSQHLISAIAREFARAGDLDSALAAASQLPGDQAQAALGYALVQACLEQGDPYLALKGAESLADPAYRARALASVAVSFKLEYGQDTLASETLGRAAVLTEDFQPVELAAWAKADLARAAGMLGNAQAAESWSGQATQAVGLVKDDKLKDRLWAYLAIQQARANLPAGARSSAGFIQNSALSAVTREAIDRIVVIEPRQ